MIIFYFFDETFSTNILNCCSTTVSFFTNIQARLDKRNIDDIICSLNSSGYFVISRWSTAWYCFNFSLETWPLALIISKLVICSFSKWLSVSCKNCSHFACSYQVHNPSLSFHGKFLGKNFGKKRLTTIFSFISFFSRYYIIEFPLSRINQLCIIHNKFTCKVIIKKKCLFL